jgi:membrane-bound lytic murein transglycosylase D
MSSSPRTAPHPPPARADHRPRALAVALLAGMAVVAVADPARAQASRPPPSPSSSPVPPAFEVMDPATALTPSAQERRAVRGHTLPETVAAPELVWLETVARSLPVDPAQALTPAERPEWTRALAVPELEIPWSRTLVRLLEHMKDDRRGREATAGLLRRFGRYRSLVEGALAAGGAPRLLAYAALARSGFEPAASRARDGAGGFWMLRTEDARQMGVEVGFWMDGRRDPQASTEAVGRHLGGLNERLGSWQRALAAFSEGEHEPDAGPLRVGGERGDESALAEAEDLAATPGGRFVAFTFAVALIGENRAALGFPAEPLPAHAFDEATVSGGLTLVTLARASGTGLESIRALNPALLRDRTPPEREEVTVRVPRGVAANLADALPAAMVPDDRLATHQLRFGESVDDVAARLKIPLRELRRLNAVRDSWELRPRTWLVLPAPGSISRAAAEEDLPAPEEAFVVGVPAGALAVPDRTRVFYRTVEGDSVAELAELFAVTAEEIVAWNSLDELARLQPRMLLQLHVPPGQPRQDVALLPESRVKVVALGSEEHHALECARRGKARVTVTARAGETLVKIARRFGLTPGDLARVNRYGWSNELSEGQKVVIYSSAPDSRREAVGRSVGPRRPRLPVPVPKAAAVGKTRQERSAQAARPPQNLPQSKGRGAASGGRRAQAGPKASNPNGAARGSSRR